jgi:2-aminoadipate transaminase
MREASRRLLQDDLDNIMQYAVIDGEDGLRKAVIDFLGVNDIEIGQENLLITTSGQQGLDLVSRLLLNTNDVVMLERPSFPGAISAFNLHNPVYAGIPLQDDGADIDCMREVIKAYANINQKPKFIYVIPEFQNPSGITMSLEKREALIELSHEYEILILEDSPYRWLRMYGEDIPSIYSLDQKQGGNNVIGVYTFSKLFCPGLRVGFNIGPAPLIEMMTNIKEGSSLGTPKYNQDMCAEFLNNMGWQGHLKNAQAYYRDKADIFLAALEKYLPTDSGVTWTKPQGGLFTWLTLPEHLDTMQLFYKAIEQGVAFVPGSAFFGENPAKNQMRVSFSYPPKEMLDEAVKRLAGCIKDEL